VIRDSAPESRRQRILLQGEAPLIQPWMARITVRTVVLAALLVHAAAPADAVTRRAFVTSVTGSGNLASWAGVTGVTVLDQGDSICRARATAAGLPNPTTYRAWLSIASTDAYCHVQGLTGQKATGCGGGVQTGGGPWYLRNGITPFTADLATLTGPAKVIYRSVIFDENGAEPDFANGKIWTGTDAEGVYDIDTCFAWTNASPAIFGTTGRSQASAYGWTGGVSWTCDAAQHLLCLEPGASQPFDLDWVPSAIAFVSSAVGKGDLGAWPDAGAASGLAAGDAICRSLASAAHLPAPESFVAWLSDGTHDARDRVTVDAVFRRVDNYPIANSHADLVDGFASNSLHVDENGSYDVFPYGVQTGTFGDGTATTDHCNGWTSSLAPFKASFGSADLARSALWTEGFANTCDNTRQIYCFANVVTVFWAGFESSSATRWSLAVP
jgi:hypothetical protein